MGQPGVYLQDRDKAAVVKLRLSGATLKEIAYRERIGITTVKRILKTNVDKCPQKPIN